MKFPRVDPHVHDFTFPVPCMCCMQCCVVGILKHFVRDSWLESYFNSLTNSIIRKSGVLNYPKSANGMDKYGRCLSMKWTLQMKSIIQNGRQYSG